MTSFHWNSCWRHHPDETCGLWFIQCNLDLLFLERRVPVEVSKCHFSLVWGAEAHLHLLFLGLRLKFTGADVSLKGWVCTKTEIESLSTSYWWKVGWSFVIPGASQQRSFAALSLTTKVDGDLILKDVFCNPYSRLSIGIFGWTYPLIASQD